MKNNILISVFTFNVENFIESLFIDLKKYGHLNKEIICLNNNSSDNTVKKINELKLSMKIPNLKIISHTTNMGYGYNKKISFDYAINNNFEKIIFIHGDNQYPASGIEQMINLLDKSTLAYGSRFLNKLSVKENMPKIKYFANPFLTNIINFLAKARYSEYFSGFRGYNVSDLSAFKYQNLSNSWVFEQQMMFEIIKKKMKIEEFMIPTVYGEQVSLVPPIKYCISLSKSVFYYFVFKRWTS
jgi:glycosyltransferase involved in cell wall biosynthesis